MKDIHTLDYKGLSPKEVQLAIDMYVSEYGSHLREIQRMSKLIDELLNELQALKRNNNKI